jgi:thiol-disulfide isomerase/thioredoxin
MKILSGLLMMLLCLSGFDVQSQSFANYYLTNVADDKPVAIQPCSTCTAVVVVFHSLNCPYDLHYAERIKKLAETYGTAVSFYLVNSNAEPEEQADKMKVAYLRWGLSIPYLADKDQILMSALNARKTPEAILLKKEGSTLRVVYQGAIDDNPQVHHDAEVKFLEIAIQEILQGKSPTVAAERAVGCTIRRK